LVRNILTTLAATLYGAIPSSPAVAPAMIRTTFEQGGEAAVTRSELEQFRAGDEDVFATLIASLQPTLRGQIRRYVGADEDLVNDLFSEVCERIFERRVDYRGDGPIAAWAAQLCARICVDHFRRNARAKVRARRFDTPSGCANDSRSEEQRVKDAEARQSQLETVTDAVVSLPPRMRAMVISHWYLGHPASEIAKEFGLAWPTVWSALSRAKRLLQARLKPRTRTPPQTPFWSSTYHRRGTLCRAITLAFCSPNSVDVVRRDAITPLARFVGRRYRRASKGLSALLGPERSHAPICDRVLAIGFRIGCISAN